jgi:hypothetical protein
MTQILQIYLSEFQIENVIQLKKVTPQQLLECYAIHVLTPPKSPVRGLLRYRFIILFHLKSPSGGFRGAKRTTF